ncbi:MAG TPA: bifunctional phosphopantothenoylcysteine decarboxylase/phosphopantothenate--cysteine ligase CoaBC [Anaerolineales bacterium]|nr:bifunctional phosphopantothenoylcysteine decarboxylase/phosphopantothenate--cysteine ligase CoaBC [Anaerolineales bacterium]
MTEKYLDQKNILLGVTGSIAAYKAADLASKLTQAGALVDVILTPAALKFITPLTFQSVTGRPAVTDEALWGTQAHVLHVGLGHTADMFVIAPATANTLAKLAHGLADNLLVLTSLSFGPGSAERPFMIAPAMDGDMLNHPSTLQNVEILSQRGAIIIGPEVGHLASGLEARGRMTEPNVLLGHIRYLLTRRGPLQGQRVVVSAGGTQEPIDPVRLITNRSSGKQGYALAQAALDAGAEVTLISAPVSLAIPQGANLLQVTSASEMETAVLSACAQADVLLMAAAVADFRPTQAVTQKIKKISGLPSIDLVPTVDILSAVSHQRQHTGNPRIVVGFAAETQDLLTNAETKLKSKHLDLMVANDISLTGSGFSADTNQVTLLYPDGQSMPLPVLTKSEVAERIIAEVVKLLPQ